MRLHTYNPPNQCPYQVSTSYTLRLPRYSPDKILQVKVTTARSNQGQTMRLHTYNPPTQCPYQVSTSYTLRLPRYSPDKILQVKVTRARSKVKSRSDHDVAHLHPLTNVNTKYQLPTPYGFRDIAWTIFSTQGHYSKVKGQIKVRQ